MFLLLLSALAWGQDSGVNDCSSWGEILPEEADPLFLGQSIEMFVSGGSQGCGDVESCTWTIEDSSGESLDGLSSTTGSPVEWTTPDWIEDCQELNAKVFLSCPSLEDPSAEVGDSLSLVVQCSDADKNELFGARGWEIQGGGCSSDKSWALLFFPALLLRIRKRSARV